MALSKTGLVDVTGNELILDADADTSITSDTDDQIDFRIGGSDQHKFGSEVVFNEQGADINFRVEGDSEANLLKVDAGNNRIGICTDPSGSLHVKGNASEHGKLLLQAGGTSGSNNGTFMQFHNNGGTEIAQIAIDEGATNEGQMIFKTGGTTTAMTIDKDGHITKPLQPAFLVKPDANQNSLAVDTYHTVQFDEEKFDLGSDFNTSTYTFTAPVTGKYQLSTSVYLYNIDKDADYILVYIDTSNNNFSVITDPGAWENDANYQSWVQTVIADMDANDTAVVKVYIQAGGAQTNLIGGDYTWFSGYLVA